MDALAVYGPTTGPPPGAPTGVTAAVEVSVMARPMFTRPLPVWAALPAGSALRARRPAMTPLDADGSLAARSAAEPATMAADAEVPVTEVVPPPGASVVIPTPGAPRKVSAPELLPDHRASFWSVAETPMTVALPAGGGGGGRGALGGAADNTHAVPRRGV